MQAWLVWTLAAAVMAPPAATPAVEGVWSGTLEAGAARLRLVLHVATRPQGGFTAWLDSLDQGAAGLPVDEVTLRDRTVSLRMKSLGASYTGTLADDGNAIAGQWIQGGAFPLTFRRGATEGPRRPQEPKRPLPYREEEVSVQSAGVKLAGTLTLPRGKGPFPAALLITGSGPQDRDETIAGHRPFLVLADHLTRNGIAVLRYDDRGVGGSTGQFQAATTADFADDAQAGLALLQSRPEVDRKRTGLIGHSEGALVAALLASRGADVGFVVLLASMGVTGEAVLYEQAAQISRVSGVPAERAAQQKSMQQATFAILKGESDSAVARKRLEELLGPALASLPAEQRAFALQRQIDTTLSPWLRAFLIYDPLPPLRAVKCPVLALFGEKDLHVPPSQNAAPVEAALKEGGNTSFTVRVLPGLNHLFQTATTGLPAEYTSIEETMAPAALTAVSDWITQRAQAAPPPR
ncbi:MAG TPA: alpha/beta fold hydrolase [Vicinamibacteria bacterium]|nr:alpha/beta fold hydrolase [Vicinamibacteria bacterium]